MAKSPERTNQRKVERHPAPLPEEQQVEAMQSPGIALSTALAPGGPPLQPHHIVQLQRAIGNRQTQQLIQAKQRATHSVVQRLLTLGGKKVEAAALTANSLFYGPKIKMYLQQLGLGDRLNDVCKELQRMADIDGRKEKYHLNDINEAVTAALKNLRIRPQANVGMPPQQIPQQMNIGGPPQMMNIGQQLPQQMPQQMNIGGPPQMMNIGQQMPPQMNIGGPPQMMNIGQQLPPQQMPQPMNIGGPPQMMNVGQQMPPQQMAPQMNIGGPPQMMNFGQQLPPQQMPPQQQQAPEPYDMLMSLRMKAQSSGGMYKQGPQNEVLIKQIVFFRLDQGPIIGPYYYDPGNHAETQMDVAGAVQKYQQTYGHPPLGIYIYSSNSPCHNYQRTTQKHDCSNYLIGLAGYLQLPGNLFHLAYSQVWEGEDPTKADDVYGNSKIGLGLLRSAGWNVHRIT